MRNEGSLTYTSGRIQRSRGGPDNISDRHFAEQTGAGVVGLRFVIRDGTNDFRLQRERASRRIPPMSPRGPEEIVIGRDSRRERQIDQQQEHDSWVTTADGCLSHCLHTRQRGELPDPVAPPMDENGYNLDGYLLSQLYTRVNHIVSISETPT